MYSESDYPDMSEDVRVALDFFEDGIDDTERAEILRDEVERLYAEVLQLRKDRQLAEITERFYNVAVKERDFERHRVDSLQLRNDRLTHALNAVADLVGPEITPEEARLDEFNLFRYELQKALGV